MGQKENISKDSIRETGVPESEFHMWRAVFAFAFVDNNLSLEEQELLHSYLHKAKFSTPQRRTLLQDMMNPQSVEQMYRRITNPADKGRFCALARAIVWCEGNMEKQEATILKRLSCMTNDDEHDFLMKSRFHPHLHDYYQFYAKTGAAGLLEPLHNVRISA